MPRLGQDAQVWQEREVQPSQCEPCDARVLSISADRTGAPMRKEELEGRKGRQADGSVKTHQVYLGCVFTQHRVDEDGRPARDGDSTTYVSSLDSIEQFGPMLRREALRRGLATAGRVVLLVDVIEAGCKTVIGSRCKQSGMLWGFEGAQNIMAFRCIHSSRRLDSFWKYRLNAHAQLNDALPLAAEQQNSVSRLLDPATGVLTWTPVVGQGESNYFVRVRVSDRRVPPLFATNTINIRVNTSGGRRNRRRWRQFRWTRPASGSRSRGSRAGATQSNSPPTWCDGPIETPSPWAMDRRPVTPTRGPWAAPRASTGCGAHKPYRCGGENHETHQTHESQEGDAWESRLRLVTER